MNDLAVAQLLGEIRAIESILRLLIAANPAHQQLRSAMNVQLQRIRDAGLVSTAPEAAFEGWDSAVRRILDA